MYIFGALEKEGYLLHAPEFYKLMKKEKIELKVGIPAISWLDQSKTFQYLLYVDWF